MPKDDMKLEVPTQWGEDKRGWHLDKTISVGHIISTLVIAVSVFTWVSSVDRRVDQNSLSIKFVKEQQQQSSARIEALRLEIKQDLNSINDKLDRLIENQGKR